MDCTFTATQEDGLCDRCRPLAKAVFPAWPKSEPNTINDLVKGVVPQV